MKATFFKKDAANNSMKPIKSFLMGTALPGVLASAGVYALFLRRKRKNM